MIERVFQSILFSNITFFVISSKNQKLERFSNRDVVNLSYRKLPGVIFIEPLISEYLGMTDT